MPKFRFTLVERTYFPISIQASTQAEARSNLEQMIKDGEIEVDETHCSSMEIVHEEEFDHAP